MTLILLARNQKKTRTVNCTRTDKSMLIPAPQPYTRTHTPTRSAASDGATGSLNVVVVGWGQVGLDGVFSEPIRRWSSTLCSPPPRLLRVLVQTGPIISIVNHYKIYSRIFYSQYPLISDPSPVDVNPYFLSFFSRNQVFYLLTSQM